MFVCLLVRSLLINPFLCKAGVKLKVKLDLRATDYNCLSLYWDYTEFSILEYSTQCMCANVETL